MTEWPAAPDRAARNANGAAIKPAPCAVATMNDQTVSSRPVARSPATRQRPSTACRCPRNCNTPSPMSSAAAPQRTPALGNTTPSPSATATAAAMASA